LQYTGGQYSVVLIYPAPPNATVSPATAPSTHNATITVLLNDHVDPAQNTVLTVFHQTVTFEPTSLGGAVLHLTSGQAFSGAIGVLSGVAGQTPQGVTIYWGDNSTPSAATLTPLGNDQYTVSGSHQYAAAGAYFIGVQSPYEIVGGVNVNSVLDSVAVVS
ncbi:MAG: hypothetical protein ACRDHE_14425, partial [Ktedonobacterales bacterium]